MKKQFTILSFRATVDDDFVTCIDKEQVKKLLSAYDELSHRLSRLAYLLNSDGTSMPIWENRSDINKKEILEDTVKGL